MKATQNDEAKTFDLPSAELVPERVFLRVVALHLQGAIYQSGDRLIEIS
ncbi:hypothetical protein IMCC26207_104186 [Actinobacteria bacterium IMCC26207]|nr:hypothetical protein IMCC26207_104186 [Actinobacteria bacterium IMCC26207]